MFNSFTHGHTVKWLNCLVRLIIGLTLQVKESTGSNSLIKDFNLRAKSSNATLKSLTHIAKSSNETLKSLTHTCHIAKSSNETLKSLTHTCHIAKSSNATLKSLTHTVSCGAERDGRISVEPIF